MYKSKFKKFGGEQIPDVVEYIKEIMEREPGSVVSVGCDSIQVRRRTIYAVTVMIYDTEVKKGAHVVFFRESCPKIRETQERLYKEAQFLHDVGTWINDELEKVGVTRDLPELEKRKYKYHLQKSAGEYANIELHNEEAVVRNLVMTDVDLMDTKATIDFIAKAKPSLIIDAAAKVGGIGANNSFPVEFLADNLTIQSNLMNAAHKAGVPNFVFLGSSCIYPRNCAQPIKEEYLMTGPLEETNSAYAVAKIAGIEMVNSYRKEYGTKWISLMPTNLYGPRDNFDLAASHVLPAFIRRFVEAAESGASKVTLWGSGAPLREFLHVDDLAKAVVLAAEKYDSSMHLNVGTGEDLSIKALAQKVANAAGFTGQIEWDASKPDGTPRKVLDVSRMRALGWKPTITLDEGIASTIAWYKEANARGEVRK
jgi:GDP-L-fucose synthase